jgi:hypothetical protein
VTPLDRLAGEEIPPVRNPSEESADQTARTPHGQRGPGVQKSTVGGNNHVPIVEVQCTPTVRHFPGARPTRSRVDALARSQAVAPSGIGYQRYAGEDHTDLFGDQRGDGPRPHQNLYFRGGPY